MNKIKELRKENNLTLKELTLELNKKGLKINDGQLSKYERENQTPRNKDFWKIIADFFDVSESYILGYTEHRNSIDLTKIFEEMKKNGFKPTPINENSEDYLEYEKFVAEIEEENEANRKIFYKKYDTNEEEVLRFKSLLELFNELTESGQKEVIKFTKYLLQSQNESTDI
ncbi:MAG: hypothetical protein WAX16_04780 [Lactococcus raffinolactis]